MKLLSYAECRAGGCVGGRTPLHNTGDGTKSVTADAEEERSRLQLCSPAAVRGLLLPDPYILAPQLSAYVPPLGLCCGVPWGSQLPLCKAEHSMAGAGTVAANETPGVKGLCFFTIHPFCPSGTVLCACLIESAHGSPAALIRSRGEG